MRSAKWLGILTVLSLMAIGCAGQAPEPTPEDQDEKADGLRAAVAHKGQHCGGFVAHPKKCAAGLTCIANPGNPDAPGVCAEVPPPKCSGLLPQFCEVCADGSTQCAHFDDSCNVVTCPKPVCTGFLPQFCEVCADGSTQCAHFDDSCNIVTCPKPVCTGLLPQFCKVCADGSTACAHFDASCNIVTCE